MPTNELKPPSVCVSKRYTPCPHGRRHSWWRSQAGGWWTLSTHPPSWSAPCHPDDQGWRGTAVALTQTWGCNNAQHIPCQHLLQQCPAHPLSTFTATMPSTSPVNIYYNNAQHIPCQHLLQQCPAHPLSTFTTTMPSTSPVNIYCNNAQHIPCQHLLQQCPAHPLSTFTATMPSTSPVNIYCNNAQHIPCQHLLTNSGRAATQLLTQPTWTATHTKLAICDQADDRNEKSHVWDEVRKTWMDDVVAARLPSCQAVLGETLEEFETPGGAVRGWKLHLQAMLSLPQWSGI